MKDPKVISFSKSGKSCLLYEGEIKGKKVFMLLYDQELYALTSDVDEASEKFIEMEDKTD